MTIQETAKQIVILNPVAIFTFNGDFSIVLSTVPYTQYSFYNSAQKKTWLIVRVYPDNFQTEFAMKMQFKLIIAEYRSRIKKLPEPSDKWYKEKKFIIKK